MTQHITISDFIDTAKQWEMSIYQFADILSQCEVWGLARRYYCSGDPNDGLCSPDGELYNPVTKAPLTKIYKTLRQLDEVNEEYEYTISVGVVDVPDYWCRLTFTVQGDSVLVESY